MNSMIIWPSACWIACTGIFWPFGAIANNSISAFPASSAFTVYDQYENFVNDLCNSYRYREIWKVKKLTHKANRIVHDERSSRYSTNRNFLWIV